MTVRKALVVGIDDYPGNSLNGCCNDSAALKSLLERNGNGNPNFDVRQINNIKSKAELGACIERCFSGNADVALFYYSGHGHIDAIGGYLVTPDYSPGDPGVSLADVLTIANDSECKERIVILDSCYSGFMGNVNTAGQDTATIRQGVTILTASRSTEPSMEINGHGVFTSLLIEALKGGAADITGRITAGGIYSYVDKALGPWEQRPIFKTNVARFTSIRDVNPQVGIGTIRKLCEYFPSQDARMELDPSFEPTNSPDDKHEVIEPYAVPANTEIFADLQKLEGIGLVVPTDEEHMYYAAMRSKGCRLTPMGKQYWRLVKENKI